MSSSSIRWVSVAALLAASIAAGAQSSAANLPIGPIYPADDKKGFSLVVGRPIKEEAAPWRARPNPEDFQLIQDGSNTSVKAARVVLFKDSEKGMALVICVDTSKSVSKSLFASIRSELEEFVARQPDGTRMALVAFGDRVTAAATFSSRNLPDRLRTLTADDDRTLFFDALKEALYLLGAPDLPARKRILVVSDGVDDGSKELTSKQTIIDLANRSGVAIDSIQLTGGQYRDADTGLATLEYLASGTNGLAFRPTPTPVTDFETEFRDALRELDRAIMQESLVITFEYEPAANGAVTKELGVLFDADGQRYEGKIEGEVPVALDKPSVFKRILAWINDHKLMTLLAGLILMTIAAAGFYARTRTGKPLFGGSERRSLRSEPAGYTDYEPATAQPAGDDFAIDEPISKRAERPATRHDTRVVGGTSFETPRPERPGAILRGVTGEMRGINVPVIKSPFSIGAQPGSNLTLKHDDYVSAGHAVLEYSRGGFYLRDEASTNGTFVNDKRLGSAAEPVRPGDRLRFGESVFEIRLPV